MEIILLCAALKPSWDLTVFTDLGSSKELTVVTGYEIKIKYYSLQHCFFHQINKSSNRQRRLYCFTLCIREAICGQTSLTKASVNINILLRDVVEH